MSLGRRHEGQGQAEEATCHQEPGSRHSSGLCFLQLSAYHILLSSKHVFLPGLPISLLAGVHPCCSVNSHTGHMTILLHAPVASGLACNPHSLPGLREPSVLWLLLGSLTSSVYPFWVRPHSSLLYPLTSETQGCLRAFALALPSAGKLSPDGNQSSLPLSAGFKLRDLPSSIFLHEKSFLAQVTKTPPCSISSKHLSSQILFICQITGFLF